MFAELKFIPTMRAMFCRLCHSGIRVVKSGWVRNQRRILLSKGKIFYWGCLIEATWDSLFELASYFPQELRQSNCGSSLRQHKWGWFFAVASWGWPNITVKLRNPPKSWNVAWRTTWQNWRRCLLCRISIASTILIALFGHPFVWVFPLGQLWKFSTLLPDLK